MDKDMEDLCEPCEREGKLKYPTLYCLECREHYCSSCGRKHLAYKMCLTHTIKPVEANGKIAGLDTAIRSATKMTGIVPAITHQQGKLTPEKAVSVIKDAESSDYWSPYYPKEEEGIYETLTGLPDDPSITGKENIYEVTLSNSPLHLKKIRGTYRLRLTLEGIQLLDRSTSAEKLYWPLVSIRKTGYAYPQNEFYIDGGRACGNLQGLFLFKAKSAKDIHEAILNMCKANQKLIKK